MKPKIFKAFFTTKRDIGTGLGLAFVQKIVLAHHGQITFESQVGEGTEFAIRLPEKYLNPEEKMSKILVIDDTPSGRKNAALTLERLGHEIVEAENATQAIAAMQCEQFDLMDGVIEFSREEDDELYMRISHMKWIAHTSNLLKL